MYTDLKDNPFDLPVILVGNKVDQQYDRMVTYAEGRKRCQELGCVAFHEISVREDVDQVSQFCFFFSTILMLEHDFICTHFYYIF